MVVVQIPTLPEYAGHVPRSLRVSLTPEQAIKLCQIRCCGLVAEGAALAGAGRVIRDNKEALKFLIESAATP